MKKPLITLVIYLDNCQASCLTLQQTNIKIKHAVTRNKPVTQFSEIIGLDREGMKRFHYLKEYLTNLLGNPAKTELEKFGSIDLGMIQWQNGLVRLTLVGIEHFNCRYSFSIGLVRKMNEEYFNKTIKDLKASGLTEEDPGK